VTAADAIVVGAGPNGLVAANHLADRGWDVLVLEAGPEPGGAVRSAEVTAPGFVSDLFSAFYPFAAVSPAIADLELKRWGLEWTSAPCPFGHALPGGRAAVVHGSAASTAVALEGLHPGDGDAWVDFMARWRRLGPPATEALLAPFPPLRGLARLAAAGGRDDLSWFARATLLPVRRMGEELFAGAGPRLLLAGSALHTDLGPDSAGSGIFGWLLTGLAQQVGFPVPVGGAGMLSQALVRRLEDRGGTVHCHAPASAITVEDGRATGVVVDGEHHIARRAVLATVPAPVLYRDLLAGVPLPERVTDGVATWQPSASTVKVDWALATPIPWTATPLSSAGTVHLSDSLDDLSRFACDLSTATVPARPFVIVGQMSTADPRRSPPGTESAWAYTHVPQRPRGATGPEPWTRDAVAAVVEAIETAIEAHAPGFRARICGRYVQGPAELEAADPNLIGGDINAGTAQLHQQIVFRPFRGWGRPETPVKRLYLAGASAHPGGGVHGAPGANAARAAVLHHRVGPVIGRLARLSPS
jgi:phytoene dehydrogenase-like protein